MTHKASRSFESSMKRRTEAAVMPEPVYDSGIAFSCEVVFCPKIT